MEITPNDNTINIDAYVNNIDDKQKAEKTPEKAENNAAKTDTVNISDAAKEIPRVDMFSHGERYMCWQCHYPHLPEVR